MKSVQSTNNEALKLIKRKKIKPALITSLSQTNGRGTMGKKWISKKGNLFVSIFFELNQQKLNFRQYALLNAYLFKKWGPKDKKLRSAPLTKSLRGGRTSCCTEMHDATAARKLEEVRRAPKKPDSMYSVPYGNITFDIKDWKVEWKLQNSISSRSANIKYAPSYFQWDI